MSLVNLSNGFQMNADVVAGLAPVDTLFIHGNLASNVWWEPALEVWRRKAEGQNLPGRMIFAEWRGCGRSAPPNSPSELHPSKLADDYIELLNGLGCRQACVVGHSTGGLIGLFAMMKSPDLFSKAVLLDSVGATGVKLDPALLDAFTQMSLNRNLTAAVMGSTIQGNDPESALFQRIVDDTMGVAKENWHGVPKALQDINILDKLPRIRQPVLVLHGELDAILPIADSRVLAEKLGQARFEELKGQGHSTNVENPALFVKLVDQFLFGRE